MRRLLLTVSLAAGLVVSADARAAGHTISLTPPAGDVNTAFLFKGRGWQPRKRVAATYFVSTTAKRPYKSYSFKAGTAGSFVFKFTRPIGLVDAGVTSRMCFRQRDTRPKMRRMFRVCSEFYVAPPLAQFMPSTGAPGDLFMIFVSGFLAGRRLDATLTQPAGATQTFSFRTRKQAGFVEGGPFGPVFVPRGGAAVRFASAVNDPLGAYTLLVTDPRAGSKARAVVVLAQS
jgi:hypothetical protein